MKISSTGNAEKMRAMRLTEGKLDVKVLGEVKGPFVGLDHQVFLITTSKGRVVFRQPVKGFGTQKLKAHVWALKQWHELGVPVPRQLAQGNDYAIEEHARGWQAKMFLKNSLQQLGKILKVMHSVKTKGYGFINSRGRGKTRSWHDFIANRFSSNLQKCGKRGLITQRTASQALKEYQANRGYLEEFNDPRLVHADLVGENVFMRPGRISSIIDAGDCISGDPLYDIGYHNALTQDPLEIDEIEKTYGTVKVLHRSALGLEPRYRPVASRAY